jgi:hypothetical protein
LTLLPPFLLAGDLKPDVKLAEALGLVMPLLSLEVVGLEPKAEGAGARTLLDLSRFILPVPGRDKYSCCISLV